MDKVSTAPFVKKNTQNVIINCTDQNCAQYVLYFNLLQVDEHLVFPGQSEHKQSFCYLTVDNFKRHVKAWYHIWC